MAFCRDSVWLCQRVISLLLPESIYLCERVSRFTIISGCRFLQGDLKCYITVDFLMVGDKSVYKRDTVLGKK